MTKIFKVISNIKHNGEDISKGAFVEEFVGADILAQDGVLKLIDGATTIEEAEAIDAEANEQEAPVEEEVAPTDTWGPTKDEEEIPEAETPEESGRGEVPNPDAEPALEAEAPVEEEVKTPDVESGEKIDDTIL